MTRKLGLRIGVAGGVPQFSVRPTPSGSAQSGQTLTAGHGTASNNPTSYAYQWWKVDPLSNAGVVVRWNGVDIYVGSKTNLGTAQTQALAAPEVGYLIGYTLYATNADGTKAIDSVVLGIVTSGTLADAYAPSSKQVTTTAAAVLGNGLTYGMANFAAISLAYAGDSRQKFTLEALTNGVAAKHTAVYLYPTDADRTAHTNYVSMTERAGTGTVADTASSNYMSMWDAAIPQAWTELYVTLVVSADTVPRAAISGKFHSRTATAKVIEVGSVSANPLSSTIDVDANEAVFVAAGATNSTDLYSVPLGYTESYDDQNQVVSANHMVAGIFDNAGGGNITGRTIGNEWRDVVGDALDGANTRLVAVVYGAPS